MLPFEFLHFKIMGLFLVFKINFMLLHEHFDFMLNGHNRDSHATRACDMPEECCPKAAAVMEGRPSQMPGPPQLPADPLEATVHQQRAG